MKNLMEETATQKLYWDDENNIVWGELDATPQSLETAQENIEAQARIRDALGKKMTRVLVDMRETTRISREARNHYAGERTASIQRATALLVASPLSATIANFFIGLNKPQSPTRMFTNEDQAIAWLRATPMHSEAGLD